ncbi:MAG: cyclic pyranopterin monophosphate synthase MoaC [Candidatus Korarchaeota archaeon]|nr:cyclic pyranopterin monophosphate synthase MoaC [Thermoproteota archaeon]MCR8463582.1 cyclic pyranopterin monophosphate synthase MoaC [Thermoproteota archaeon]MCR8470599.1 cyclic pyranopterin monophosphate synthase MoaC [Thermoproteota archaeon]MCR8472610.1 cyclic pyranopterin monophosphate synthase MoaC [Thermoproteota archaeon]MCR8473770.1 cyclic pyranopterin monophosphate synthase MoaC [Thermoproteota archaeon]
MQDELSLVTYSMARMVDITHKKDLVRIATARGKIHLRRETIQLIKEGRVEKGDVVTITKIVAIDAVKRTSELLPFCHPIGITHVDADVRLFDDYVEVEVTVKGLAKTGVEMEALTGVSLALLNVWDMVKKYEKDETGNYPWTKISDIVVVKKVKLDESQMP